MWHARPPWSLCGHAEREAKRAELYAVTGGDCKIARPIFLVLKAKWHARQKHGAIQPDNVIPTQHLFRAIEQFCETAAGGFERKITHAIRRIRGRVPENVEHLLLARNLIKTRVLR